MRFESACTVGQTITLELDTAERTAKGLTKAQRTFLLDHTGKKLLNKWNAHRTYDFVGRVRDAGLIEIVGRWPFDWKGTKLTEFGLRVHAAISVS